MTTDTIAEVPIDQIVAGDNDRKTFTDEPLAELAESIRRNGLAQPITVRARPDGDGFEIIAGERRYRAHQLIGAASIRAIITDQDDRTAAATMLLENVNRVDLNPIDEANAYLKQIDRFGYTHAEVAGLVGKKESYVRGRVALLNLDPKVQDAVASGAMWLSFGQDLTSLDTNRQLIALRVFSKDPKMTLGEWEALVARLRREQNEEAEVGLFDLQVDDYVAAAKKGSGRLGPAGLVKALREAVDIAKAAGAGDQVAHLEAELAKFTI